MKFTFSILFAIFAIFTVVLFFNQEGYVEGQEMDNFTKELMEATKPSNETPDFNTQESNQSEEYVRVVFTPLYRTTISSELPVATVQTIYKRMGETFHKDDILLKLDDTIFAGLLKKAQSALEKANSQLLTKQQLFQDEIASSFELKVAESDVATAKSDLITAKRAFDACTIKAPYEGEVVSLFVEEHELVQQGKPLIEIVDDVTLIGRVLMNSSMLKQISIGQEVKIRVKETNSLVTGKIIRIDSVIDPASSTVKVDIEIDNKERKLRAGMIGITQIKSK